MGIQASLGIRQLPDGFSGQAAPDREFVERE